MMTAKFLHGEIREKGGAYGGGAKIGGGLFTFYSYRWVEVQYKGLLCINREGRQETLKFQIMIRISESFDLMCCLFCVQGIQTQCRHYLLLVTVSSGQSQESSPSKTSMKPNCQSSQRWTHLWPPQTKVRCHLSDERFPESSCLDQFTSNL